jgi:hypothetical protein
MNYTLKYRLRYNLIASAHGLRTFALLVAQGSLAMMDISYSLLTVIFNTQDLNGLASRQISILVGSFLYLTQHARIQRLRKNLVALY